MTQFTAKVVEDIPAHRLIALGGINRDGNPEEGWDTVYLILSRKGWIPDMVSTKSLNYGDFVNVTIKNNPIWRVEAAEDLPAGTLVQSTDDGRVKHYVPADGNHIGYTTHSVKSGDVVTIVRKYGGMPQSQEAEGALKIETATALLAEETTSTRKGRKKKNVNNSGDGEKAT